MKEIIFYENINGWRKYFGLIYAFLMSFGFCLIALFLFRTFNQRSVQNFFNFFNLITNHIIPIFIFTSYIYVIIEPLKKQNIIKILTHSSIILLIIFLSFVLSRFIENNLCAWLGLSNLKITNNETLSKKIGISTLLGKIFAILEVSLIGPFCEEIIYRVCFFRVIRNKIGISSHIFTALLFAFQHISVGLILYGRTTECLFIFSYFLFSLIISLAYEKLKTPVPGILAHIFYNFIQMIFY